MVIDTARSRLFRPACEWLGRQLIAERERWILWLPVALGLGIGVYFALPMEPPRVVGVAGFALACLLAVLIRKFWRTRLLVLGLVAFALGFVVAQTRTQVVASPVLDRALGFAIVEGEIESVEPGPKGPRVILSVASLNNLPEADKPARVRLRLRPSDMDIQPGDHVRVRGRLAPPPSASYPGGYDFSRKAWFARLGAVGFAFGPVERLGSAGDNGFLADARQYVASLRARISRRITSRIDGPAGGVAAALATGLRGDIPEEVRQQMRDSGLAHLLAISGLHLGLVAGFVFGLIRGGLVLVPGLALRWPLKKIAAVAALLAAAAYMFLAGGTIPTQRAFVMTAIVLLAILLNRTGISLRLIALAATVVLLLRPEALLSVSFQMSFAASIALVTAYEGFSGRFRISAGEVNFPRRVLMYLAAVAFTTVIASLATGPFAIFHFNRLALLGTVANMVAVPVAALWVMPLEVIALVLMPLGLDGLVLPLLGWGVEVILTVAATVSTFPLAAITLPGPGQLGLLLIVAGGLWLTLWQGRWRWAGVTVLLAGLATSGQTSAPDILIADNARLIAFRTGPDLLHVSRAQGQTFVREVWERRTGNTQALAFPAPGAGNGALRCDQQSCIAQIGTQRVAFVTHANAFPEDCRTADVVVSSIPAPWTCKQPGLVIDWFDFWRDGAHAVWLDQNGAGPRIWHARSEFPARPWMRASPR